MLESVSVVTKTGEVGFNQNGSPYYKIQLRNVSNDSFLSQINFTVDKSTGLKIGDEITVRAEYSASNASQAGYIIDADALEKTYSVDSVDQYITLFEQIDSDTMDVVVQQAEDILESWKANNCKDDVGDESRSKIIKHEYTEFVKEANLFLSLKSGLELGWGSLYNRLGLVYSVHETYTYKNTYSDLKVSEKDIYFCVVINDFIVQDVYSLFKESFILQELLEAEMDASIGYVKNEKNSSDSDNKRNEYSTKTVKSQYGEFPIEMPRDRNGDFEPKIVPKYQRDISGIEEKVISLYARGMSTRDIHDQLQDLYGIEMSADMVSKITDKILPEVKNT